MTGGFPEASIKLLFERPELEFDPSIMSRKLEGLIRAKYFRSPAQTARQGAKIYKGFDRPEVLESARAFMESKNQDLSKIQVNYGVPKEIIVSITLVETKLGEFTGTKSAFNSLASMALAGDFEITRGYINPVLLSGKTEKFAKSRCREKSEWALNELKALIRYSSQCGVDPLSIKGSIYGAIGYCQFMPSQVFLYGVDADGDGKIDLFSWTDSLHSMANYLKNHGWKPNMSRKKQYRVILSYNHSRTYANTVLAIAERLNGKAARKGTPGPA